jgi:hypothetical protein
MSWDNFVYFKFGKMAEPRKFVDWIYAYNEEGDYRKINRNKYPRADEIYDKMVELIGHEVILRTSKNTGNYGRPAEEIYFSDVYLDNGISAKWPESGDPKVIQTITEQSLVIDRLNKSRDNLQETSSKRIDDLVRMDELNQRVENMPLDEYQELLRNDHDFANEMAWYNRMQNERLRSDEQKRTYKEDKERIDRKPPLGTRGFAWAPFGTLVDFNVIEGRGAECNAFISGFVIDDIPLDDEGTIDPDDLNEHMRLHGTLEFEEPAHPRFLRLFRKKLPLLKGRDCYVLANDEGRFVDITIDDGTLDKLQPYTMLTEIEMFGHLQQKITSHDRREAVMAKEDAQKQRALTKVAQDEHKKASMVADEWERSYQEAQGKLDSFPDEFQTLMAEDIELLVKRWDYLESQTQWPVVVTGMAIAAERLEGDSGKLKTVYPRHVDSTLAVRCGLDMTNRQRLRLNPIEHVYDDHGNPTNRIICTINDSKDKREVTAVVGRSTQVGSIGKWMLKSVWKADPKLERTLKKLGYKPEQRDQKRPLSYFLDLYKQAVQKIEEEERPKQG